jgi:hypothetical protein
VTREERYEDLVKEVNSPSPGDFFRAVGAAVDRMEALAPEVSVSFSGPIWHRVAMLNATKRVML